MGLFGFVSFAYGLVMGIRSELPQLDPARSSHRLEQNGYIYDSSGKRVLAVLRGSEARVLIDSNDIAPVMKQAIVAIEDRRFSSTAASTSTGSCARVWQDVRNNKVVQGGSTITQQFVKNTYVKSNRTISRKLKEAALAWQLEQVWPKDRILTAYLNTIYFGNGAYGIEQASRVYFGHGASLADAGRGGAPRRHPVGPEPLQPGHQPEDDAPPRGARCSRRCSTSTTITYNEFRLANRRRSRSPTTSVSPGTRGPAQYFVDYVKQQLVDRYGRARSSAAG